MNLNPTPRSMKPLVAILPLLLLATVVPGVVAQSRSNTVFQKYHGEVDRSVERALEFLASNQNQDGTFPDAYGRSTGIVALAGMAFLSKGHTPGRGKYEGNLKHCIQYILSSQRSNGLLDMGDSGHGVMYAHNIASLFLSECSGMVDPQTQGDLDKVLGNAMRLILAAQAVPKTEKHQGGWRYKPDSRDSDLSCSGWALMALRSAKLNGAPIPDAAIKSSVEYVLRNHDPKEGRFGYTDPWGHSETLTGCGLLCLELSGFHGTESTFRAGDYILKIHQRIVGNAHEFYANYYNAQAMFQLGGKYWETYAAWMYPHYIANQQPDGSWSNSRNGTTYGTTMMVLSFTVPYRQLPIYQRDETVDEDS